MGLITQIPQFAPLNIPAPTQDAPGATDHRGLLEQIMGSMGGGKPGGSPLTGQAGSATSGAATAGLNPQMLAQILASLGMAL